MEKKKKASVLIATAGLLGILLVSMLGFGLSPVASLPDSPQSSGEQKAAPTVIPGNIYTGKYIQIGVNKGGTFGVGNGTDGYGTGFQYPIGRQYESLAIWWWGEGYVVAYKVKVGTVWVDKVAYWWPSLGYPPPAESNIKPIYATQTRNDDNRAIYEVKVQTLDKALNMTFKFSFPKPQKYVLLQTTIVNNGAMGEVRDVLYKRIVDWDIHWDTGNTWTNDAHSAYASYYNATEDRVFEMSVSGHAQENNLVNPVVGYVDLWAWDDISPPIRDPGWADIQSHNAPLYYFDGNAAVYYDFGNMAKGASKPAITVYQAGWNFVIP